MGEIKNPQTLLEETKKRAPGPIPAGSADVALSPDQKKEQALETIKTEMARSIQETKTALEDMLGKISLAKKGKAKFQKGEKGYRAAEVNIKDILRDIPLDEMDRIKEDMKNLGTYSEIIYGSPDKILESIRAGIPAILNMKKTKQGQEIRRYVSQYVWDTFYKKSTGEKTKHLLDFIRDVRGKKIDFVPLEEGKDVGKEAPQLLPSLSEVQTETTPEMETAAPPGEDIVVVENPFPPSVSQISDSQAPASSSVEAAGIGSAADVPEDEPSKLGNQLILEEEPSQDLKPPARLELNPDQKNGKNLLLEEMADFKQAVRTRLEKEKVMIYSLDELQSGLRQHAEQLFHDFLVEKKVFLPDQMKDVVDDIMDKI